MTECNFLVSFSSMYCKNSLLLKKVDQYNYYYYYYYDSNDNNDKRS